MFRLRPAVFSSPPSSPTPGPSPFPPPLPLSDTHIPPRSAQADTRFQYKSRPLLPVTIQPSPVPVGIQQGSARLPSAPHHPTNTPPTPASTSVSTNTHTHAAFQYSSRPLNPIVIPVRAHVPPQPHGSLAGPGVPAASGNALQRSPHNARDRIRDRACREPLPTGHADEDTDENTGASTVDITALSLGAGLRAMWDEQMGRTLSGPGAPPSPPRLSRRAKGKWKATERSPPPSPTSPTTELTLIRFPSTTTRATADERGDWDTGDDTKRREWTDAPVADVLPVLRPTGPPRLHRSLRNNPTPVDGALIRKTSEAAPITDHGVSSSLDVENEIERAQDAENKTGDIQKQKQTRQDAHREERGLLTRTCIDAMFSHLEPHLRPDYPKRLAHPRLSQEEIDVMFSHLPVGLRPYYVALEKVPPPLKKGLIDLGKSDKGPMTRSKSRRVAQFGVTNGASEVPKEEKKVVGRSKQGMKRKRAAGVADSEIKATATAPTSGKGKEREPARTKSGEKVTIGAVKTKAQTQGDTSKAPVDIDSPRPTKRVKLTDSREKLVIRLPPRAQAALRVREPPNASAGGKASLNENEGKAIQENDRDSDNEEIAAALTTSVKSNNGGDVSKATNDKIDKDTSTTANSNVHPGEFISTKIKGRRARKG
ncbi:hypothetical protein PLEOSDRAFT_158948 [Pleurotus ostreatus PC15]|uniref:Uncharacterized protein n=1 Tax=Pleurotus ostreatus (strain PC15) TaxID=1137138 RepID=A0A067NGG0_PLEO1|nr:hypothetical protein PLEOSDRAFT_158948 [Pleurotus ostreatus PC15]